MESVSGTSQNTLTTATTTTVSPTTTIISASRSAVAIATDSSTHNCSNSATIIGAGSNLAINLATILPANLHQSPQQYQPQFQIDTTKQEDVNNLSLASAISEGQRSLSGAPSASSSPILSPPGKIFGRNVNGTTVATSRPSNEAEVQLYRVLQRASLLVYFDTLVEMGGDDVQQLYEAGEQEFLEIMALVGMASKPLHVRRLQKVLHEWAGNPSLFQGPMTTSISGLCDTSTKPIVVLSSEPSPTTSSLSRSKFSTFASNSTSAVFNPTPLMSTVETSSSHFISQICSPTISGIQPHSSLVLSTALPTLPPSAIATTHLMSGNTSHLVSSSSPQLTPVLTEVQITRIKLGAEKIARQLPQREPRAQTSKKRTTRELEQVIAMNENDPRRMDEIRKYSAIYGRYDCKRRAEKPLTLHEVCVNEAAAQLCRLVPALLKRRDELFPLARLIVKEAGFSHSASIARYGGLLPQMQAQSAQRSNIVVDCESSDTSLPLKRQRLGSNDTTLTPDVNREASEDSRYNLFAMYQKFTNPHFDLSEISKFPLDKSEFNENDNDNDNDSRFSFSNSRSPSMPHNGSENEGDLRERINLICDEAHTTVAQSQNQLGPRRHSISPCQNRSHSEPIALSRSPLAGVQVISAAGSQIIAVANPALALSPTLNDALNMKREADSPDI